MCIYCADDAPTGDDAPENYYFYCAFCVTWYTERPVPMVFLNPVIYYDEHRMMFDGGINKKFEGLLRECVEGQYEWDEGAYPVSNVLEMYDKLIEWGFKYNTQFVEDMMDWEENQIENMHLTPKMVTIHEMSKLRIKN